MTGIHKNIIKIDNPFDLCHVAAFCTNKTDERSIRHAVYYYRKAFVIFTKKHLYEFAENVKECIVELAKESPSMTVLYHENLVTANCLYSNLEDKNCGKLVALISEDDLLTLEEKHYHLKYLIEVLSTVLPILTSSKRENSIRLVLSYYITDSLKNIESESALEKLIFANKFSDQAKQLLQHILSIEAYKDNDITQSYYLAEAMRGDRTFERMLGKLILENRLTFKIKHKLQKYLVEPSQSGMEVVYNLLGLINLILSPIDYTAAQDYFDRAIALGSIFAINNRANLYFWDSKLRKSDYPSVVMLYEKAIEYNMPDAMISRACVHIQDVYDKPNYIAAAYLARKAILQYWKLEMFEEMELAIAFLKKLAADHPSTTVCYHESLATTDTLRKAQTRDSKKLLHLVVHDELITDEKRKKLVSDLVTISPSILTEQSCQKCVDLVQAVYFDRALQGEAIFEFMIVQLIKTKQLKEEYKKKILGYVSEKEYERNPSVINLAAIIYQLNKPVNMIVAVKLLRKAIALRHPYSASNLANIYKLGIGRDIDYVTASSLYRKAIAFAEEKELASFKDSIQKKLIELSKEHPLVEVRYHTELAVSKLSEDLLLSSSRKIVQLLADDDLLSQKEKFSYIYKILKKSDEFLSGPIVNNYLNSLKETKLFAKRDQLMIYFNKFSHEAGTIRGLWSLDISRKEFTETLQVFFDSNQNEVCQYLAEEIQEKVIRMGIEDEYFSNLATVRYYEVASLFDEAENELQQKYTHLLKKSVTVKLKFAEDKPDDPIANSFREKYFLLQNEKEKLRALCADKENNQRYIHAMETEDFKIGSKSLLLYAKAKQLNFRIWEPLKKNELKLRGEVISNGNTITNIFYNSDYFLRLNVFLSYKNSTLTSTSAVSFFNSYSGSSSLKEEAHAHESSENRLNC